MCMGGHLGTGREGPLPSERGGDAPASLPWSLSQEQAVQTGSTFYRREMILDYSDQ